MKAKRFNLLVIVQPLLFFACASIAVSCQQAQHNKTGDFNHLKFSANPYLKAHADNPVNWYEWGEEALDRAKKENKPLLISIGYAACHWCHVMEAECYMDTAVARIMNENFICIKVDREERPDIDNTYTNALQLISGSSGWPLHAFAIPDGKPFFAGTYFPKKTFQKLLLDIAATYRNKQKLVITQANAIANGIAQNNIINTEANESFTPVANKKYYENISDSLLSKADEINGGIKGSPKFPNSSYTEFLLEHYYITKQPQSLKQASINLKKMALGGIYDQLEGGFARYSTDSTWNKPHFEKMLYDNGLLVSLYSHAYQLTKDDFYKKITEETIAFIQKYLAAPGGGFYSSLNADTEAGEGAFYTWREKDFKDAVGNNENVTAYYNITGSGNAGSNENILYARSTPEEFAAAKNIGTAAFIQQLNTAKQQLLLHRKKRTAPTADTKIICAWNSIMLKGFIDAYAATANDAYLETATRCASFIEKNLLGANGQLQRSYTAGKTGIPGFLDDYAWTAAAFEKLYEASLNDHWLLLSKQLTDYVILHFYDKKTGLFVYTEPHSAGAGFQKINIDDRDIPSANAVLAKHLQTLGVIFNDTSYQHLCAKMINTVAESVKSMPAFYTEWCRLVSILQAKTYEIAVTGRDAAALCKELRLSYLPTSIIAGSTTRQDQYPLLKDKWAEGRTMIYVCTGNTCRRPEEQVAKALAQLTQ